LRQSAQVIAVLVLASAAAPPPPVAAISQATVRVMRASRASEAEWKRADPAHRREILVRQADGSTTRLLVIDHE